jgi:hypothetical protein
MTSPIGANDPDANVPVILRAYMGFALIASALSLSVFFAPSINRAIVPYTGWSGLSIYMFTIYFAFSAMRTGKRKQVYNVARLLALAMLFGFLDTYRHTAGPGAAQPDFGNPYLTYNNLRPLFTITLPAIWLFLLISPMMKRWVREAPGDRTDSFRGL